MVRWAMSVNRLEHRRNEAILEEAETDPIATVMRSRRLEWFGHMKRRQKTENITTAAMMKMVGKCRKERPKLRWTDTIRRGVKVLKMREERPLNH